MPTPYCAGLLRCTGCGHVHADLKVGDEELKRIYGTCYFTGEEYQDYEKEIPALRRNFRARLKPLKRRFPQGAQLWEIGSAYGFFLREASAHFRVAGCDISEHAAGFAERELGVSVVVADYLEIPPPTEEFDVVCMWDTIEHLRDPAETVAKAFMELRPGGEIAISTGDVSSLLARVRGHRWRLIHPPTHLHYFSAGSIRSLLTRTGFRDISISHPSFWRSADAVAFRLLGYPSGKPAAPVYRMLKSAGVLNFAFPLNLGDLMVVTARK